MRSLIVRNARGLLLGNFDEGDRLGVIPFIQFGPGNW